MTENKVCKGCSYNHYPECYGTKMVDGNYMSNDNFREGFECGQKDDLITIDFSIKKKSDLELRIEELEEKINILEEEKL